MSEWLSTDDRRVAYTVDLELLVRRKGDEPVVFEANCTEDRGFRHEFQSDLVHIIEFF